MKPPPKDRKPTCEDMMNAFKEMLRLYNEDLLPEEVRPIVEQFINEFRTPKPN